MLAQMTDSYPDEVLLIGCQPEELEDYGGSLRPSVRTALDESLPLAIERLARWGAQPVARTAPRAQEAGVNAPGIALAAYESGRPSAEAACRIGDPRFLAPAAE